MDARRIILGFLTFLTVIIPCSALPQEYNQMSAKELASLYKDSCETGQMANCVQLGLMYQKANASAQAKEQFTKACKGGNQLGCELLEGEKFSGSLLLFWSSILLIGLAVFLIMRQMFQDEDQYKAQEKLEEGIDKKDIAKHGIILKYSRPFFRRYITPIVSSMKNKKWIKDKYKKKLANAGLNDYLSVEDFFSFKLFLIVAFPIVFLFLREFLEETWPLELIPLVAVIGFIYPDIWIKKKAENRQQEIILAMPFSVDMLALSVEAGLDFVAAMSKVIEKAKANPLTEEFQTMIKEIKVGASRAEALRNLSWRVDLIQVSSFCATLIAADSVGASIGPILKALSAEIRQKRSSEVEKAGAKAATKILLPMVFLILPAVVVIVFAPMALQAFSGN